MYIQDVIIKGNPTLCATIRLHVENPFWAYKRSFQTQPYRRNGKIPTRTDDVNRNADKVALACLYTTLC